MRPVFSFSFFIVECCSCSGFIRWIAWLHVVWLLVSLLLCFIMIHSWEMMMVASFRLRLFAQDAASLAVTILNKRLRGQIFLGCDNHPLSRSLSSPSSSLSPSLLFYVDSYCMASWELIKVVYNKRSTFILENQHLQKTFAYTVKSFQARSNGLG